MERWADYIMDIVNKDIIKNEGEDNEDEDDVQTQRDLRINTEVPQKYFKH